jgi:hypothetical protein
MKKVLFFADSVMAALFMFNSCSNSSVKTNRLVIIALVDYRPRY